MCVCVCVSVYFRVCLESHANASEFCKGNWRDLDRAQFISIYIYIYINIDSLL